MQPLKERFFLKSSIRLLALLNLAIILIVLLFTLWLWSPLGEQFFGSIPWFNLSGTRLFLFFMTVAALFSTIGILMMAISQFTSRLQLSDQGLDYMYWPYIHIRCSWGDVQAIVHRKEIVEAEVLLLKRATETGLPITTQLRKWLMLDTQYFIPLNILDGWPSGDLANALRYHAPQLFLVSLQ